MSRSHTLGSRRAFRAAQGVSRAAKRRAIAAFILAILAVGGMGAAVTSAAWTDTSSFSAQATSQTFSLQASLDGINFSSANGSNSAPTITIPASALANLLPGDTKTINLWVKNSGTSNSSISASSAWSNSTFTTAPTVTFSNAISTNPQSGTTLAGAATLQFSATVTVPANWDASNQGKSGTLTVTVAGIAVH